MDINEILDQQTIQVDVGDGRKLPMAVQLGVIGEIGADPATVSGVVYAELLGELADAFGVEDGEMVDLWNFETTADTSGAENARDLWDFVVNDLPDALDTAFETGAITLDELAALRKPRSAAEFVENLLNEEERGRLFNGRYVRLTQGIKYEATILPDLNSEKLRSVRIKPVDPSIENESVSFSGLRPTEAKMFANEFNARMDRLGIW